MLFGHEEKIKIFRNLAENGHLGQSYLFFGDAQIGKATFAKLFGYFLEYGRFEELKKPLIDTRFFSPTDDVIGIETALDVRKFLWATPFNSPRKFAIIDQAEKLTTEAQSAMLKIVEEPPPKALLIFVTHEAEALFPPLLSRLTKIYFPRLPSQEINQILTEHYQVAAAKAGELTGLAFGRLGYALSLLKPQETNNHEPDLGEEIEEEILRLRHENLAKNAKKIGLLLSRLVMFKRYNLNQNLQHKAISYELSHA